MTTDATTLASAPPSSIRYKRKLGPITAVRALWRSRELIRTMAEREIRARYKQATLGFAWAIITPVALMVVFTIFFKPFAEIETNGVPYTLFTYVALLPWAFFSSSVGTGGQALISNIPILSKIACPREVFPLASMVTSGVDMCLSLIALVVLFVINGFVPKVTTAWVPLILAVQIAFTAGVVLLISSIMVYMRDLRHALPLTLQLGLFATPVAYGMDKVPESIRDVYGYINPLAPVIDGYRRTVLYGQAPDWATFIPAAVSASLLLFVGYIVFKRLEVNFADVA